MTFVPYTQSGYASYSEGFGTLSATDHKRPEQHIVPFVKSHQALTTDTLLARDFKDVNTDSVDSKLVVHETVAFVKAKRAQNDTDDETWEEDRPAPTLNAFDQGDTRTTVAVLSFDTQFVSNANVFENQAPTLKSTQTSPSVTQPIPIQDGREIDKKQNGMGTGMPGDPAYTLDTTGAQAVAQPIAFSAGNSAHARSIAITENGTPPLRAGASGTNQTPTVMTPELAVRRLTPLECERLMGWPDNHTLHRADGTTNSDSARYKQCGNGVAAPVAAWIAKHLKATLQ